MFTGRVKSHRCGITEILCASKAVFRQPGWEERGKKQRLPCPQSQDTEWQELSVWDLERIEQEEHRKPPGPKGCRGFSGWNGWQKVLKRREFHDD